jgi:hypothetical protein
MNTTTTAKAIEEVQTGDIIVIDNRSTFEVWEVRITVDEFGPFVRVTGYKTTTGAGAGPDALERVGGHMVEVR